MAVYSSADPAKALAELEVGGVASGSASDDGTVTDVEPARVQGRAGGRALAR